MKKYSDIIKIISFIFLVIISISYISKNFSYNSDIDMSNIRGFTEREKNTFDVIMLGSSEAFAAYSPNLAWKDYHYTSYIYGTNAQPLSVMEYQINEIEKTQNPQLYVIEIYGVTYESTTQTEKNRIRRFLDNIPFSLNKLDALIHLAKKNYSDFIFYSISNYHNSFKDFSQIKKAYIFNKKLQSKRANCLNGSLINSNDTTKLKDSLVLNDYNVSENLSSKSAYYLHRLLKKLKDMNVKVLFYFAPHLYDNKNLFHMRRVNEAGEIIKSYGFEFINYSNNLEGIGIDRKRDFLDFYHMNVYGQEKFTAMLAKEISNRIVINDKSNATKTEWNSYYDLYKQKANIAKEYCDKGKRREFTSYK